MEAGRWRSRFDNHGGAYLTGAAYLKDFPVTPDAFQREPHEGDESSDAFVTKIGRRGEIVYSTRLGSGNRDLGRGIDADADGNAYVTGMTTPFHLGRRRFRRRRGRSRGRQATGRTATTTRS